MNLRQNAFTSLNRCKAFYFYFLIDFEASFIRLIDKLTNGSRIEINETGML